MLTEKQQEELVELLSNLSNKTKLYFGCDSQRSKNKEGEWVATYATILVVHMDGRKGCRIFSHIDRQLDFDKKKNRPSQRLMNEVYRVAALFNQLQPLISEFDVEIHLDISTDPKNGSNCVATQAAGYILGATGLEPKLKPESWAASFGADGIHRGFNKRKVNDKAKWFRHKKTK